jgi:hypothetical protein
MLNFGDNCHRQRGVKLFSVVAFITSTQSVLLVYSRDTVHSTRLVHVLVKLLLLQRNARYVIVVDLIQTLMCFNVWNSVSVRQEVQREYRSPMDSTTTSKWKCHNFNCEMRAMNLTQYRMRIEKTLTEGPRNIPWRSGASVSVLAEWTSVSRRSSSRTEIFGTVTSTHCRCALFT